VAWGGRWRCGHGDGASGGAPASSHALRWLTKRYQRTREEVVGCWGASGAAAVKNGRLVTSLRRLWRRQSEEALGCCCGEEGGARKAKWEAQGDVGEYGGDEGAYWPDVA